MKIRITKVKIRQNGEKTLNKKVDEVIYFSELENVRKSLKTESNMSVIFEYEEIQDSE